MIQLYKTLSLALAFTCSAALAMAQDGLPPVHIGNTGITANKGAGTGSRLIAQSHYNGTFAMPSALAPYDSQRYIYPNTTTNLQSQMLSLQYGTSWVLMRKSDYTYNSAGKMTYAAFANWGPGATAYTPSGQSFYMLNSAGFVIEDSNQVWLTSTSAYRNNVRNFYTLNAAGQITDQVYQDWDNGSNNLINYYHHINTYNAQGMPVQQTLQDWDASIHWMDYSRSTYAYDAGGTNIQSITGEQRTGSNPGLKNVYQNVYTNTTGNPTTILSNLWNNNTSSYGPSSRLTYTYDANGNNITSTVEQWDVATSAYKQSEQYVYTYNTYNQMTSDTRSFWNGTTYAITSNSTRYNYYYEPYTTTTTGIAATGNRIDVAVYPTVCNRDLFVDARDGSCLGYGITSLTGAVLANGQLQRGINNIDVANLAAGMYLLRIQAGNDLRTYRIVKN